MSDSTDDRVFGLIAAAEDQQAAVQAALARLAAQEEALNRERQLLAEDRAALQAELATLRRTTAAVGPELRRGTQEAVRIAVAASLADAGGVAVQAVETASRPLLDRLAGVAALAQEVEASLRRVVGWVTWRLLGQMAAVVAAGVLLLVLANVSTHWWTERRLAFAQAQKSVLEAQIARLQDTRDALAQAGGKAKIRKCGPSARLCIRVDEAAPIYAEGLKYYRVIEGY